MKTADIFRMAFDNAVRGKLRSILTLCAVSIGVAAVLIVVSSGWTARVLIGDRLDAIGLSGISVSLRRSAEDSGINMTLEDAAMVVAQTATSSAMPVTIDYSSYRFKNWQGNVMIYGIDEQMDNALNIKLLYGSLPTKRDIAYGNYVAVIDDKFAEQVYKRKNVVGKKIDLFLGSGYYSFEIAGVISSQSFGIEQLLGETIPVFVYVPISVVQSISGDLSIDNIIAGDAEDAEGESATALLNEKYGGNYFKYDNLNSFRVRIDETLELAAVFLGVIAAVSILVAGLGIMNTMLSVAMERKREVGIYMAIGASKRDIMLIFLTESYLLSACGGAAGILLSLLLSLLAKEIIGYQLTISLNLIIACQLAAIACGIIFGSVPSVKASSLNPIEAIGDD